jgi:hypothetical protein
MLAGLVAVLGRHVVEIIKLKAYAIAIYAVAAVSLLFAFVFALVSLRHWIVMTFNASYPDMWICAGFIIVAGVLAGVAYYMGRREPPSRPAADLAFLAAPAAGKFALRRISPRTVVVGVVLIAGLMLGRRLTQRPSD